MKTDHYFWQARYRQQVRWTTEVRRYFLSKTGLSSRTRILEVGCGSGALLEALHDDGFTNLFGMDIDLPALSLVPGQIPAACADGLSLPYANGSFKACLCHFYLLWMPDALSALLEMKRVVRSGGWLAVLAEPDYSTRVDEPAELEALGKLQTQSLINQGAHLFIGKDLLGFLNQIGLVNIRSGVLTCGQGETALSPVDRQIEWDVLKADLRGLLDDAELQRYQEMDRAAWQAGSRTLYVPVHFAFGQIPG